MSYREALSVRGVASLLLALACERASAQEGMLHARVVQIGVIGDRIDRRDETISPGRYGGILWGGRLAHEGASPTQRTLAAVEFRSGTLTGNVNASSVERAYDGVAEVAYLRATHGVFLGATLRARVTAIVHRYGQSGFDEDYGFLTLALSPTVDWDRGDQLHVRASVPLAALVSHPYSRLNVTDGRLPSHFAGPWEMRGALIEVAHLSNAAARVALRTSYALELQSLREQPGLASLDNRFLAAAVVRFGRRP